MIYDFQSELYGRFVRRGDPVDDFSAKRLYPGLSSAEARRRIERLRVDGAGSRRAAANTSGLTHLRGAARPRSASARIRTALHWIIRGEVADAGD